MQVRSERLVRQLIIATVMLGSFMGATDSSIVVISLTTISRFFDVSMSQVFWIMILYLQVIINFLITIGRLGDTWGQKKIFITGFMVFTVN
jgi:MFS family permease